MQPEDRQDKMDEILEEVRRTIERWFFWVSVTGFIYVKPRQRSLSLRDLADILKRLRLVCDEHFPNAIAFEFSDCLLSTRRKRTVMKLVREFAGDIQAHMRTIPEGCEHSALFMLRRTVRRSGGQQEKEAYRSFSRATEALEEMASGIAGPTQHEFDATTWQ